MNSRISSRVTQGGLALLLVGIWLSWSWSIGLEAARQFVRPVVIVGGTLFDGTGDPPRHNDAIYIEQGRIEAIGLEALNRAPRSAEFIDATDKWILPGLIDGHVHFFQTGGLDARPDIVPSQDGRVFPQVVRAIQRAPQRYLRAYVCAGVTSVVDMGGPLWMFDVRTSREIDGSSPRIAFSGPLIGTHDPPELEIENDEPIWLMDNTEQVASLVDRVAARQPDMVKIWFVHRPGDDLQAQAQLVHVAIDRIHEAGLRAAVHATTLETARIAVERGADILVHSVGDQEVDPDFVAKVVEGEVIYVPTLLVGQSYRDLRMRQVTFESFEQACAPEGTIASFDILGGLSESALPRPTAPRPNRLAIQQRNLMRLADAGAVIAAGTDAGNIRTLHGASLHREFVLMAEAGLSPTDILLSATRNGAKVMGREDEVGQIREGMAGDLLLLDADPLVDIRNTRRIFMVIRGGSIYHR